MDGDTWLLYAIIFMIVIGYSWFDWRRSHRTKVIQAKTISSHSWFVSEIWEGGRRVWLKLSAAGGDVIVIFRVGHPDADRIKRLERMSAVRFISIEKPFDMNTPGFEVSSYLRLENN